jgi:hypothetical protein
MAVSEERSPQAERLSTSTWLVENLLRPLLVTTMLACLAMPLVRLLEWLFEGWDGTYLVVFVFVAGLEGILSERALRRRRMTGYAYLASRAAEVLILLLLLKLFSYVSLGLDALQADLRLLADPALWLMEPGRLISNQDLLAAMVFLPLWIGSLGVARMLSELDVGAGKGRPPADKTSTEYYLWLTQPPIARDRQSVLEGLAETFLWGGVAMLVAATVIQFLFPEAAALAVPMLLYFALGIALLSQGRYSVLHTIWERQGILVQRSVARRWLLWGGVFLVGVALAALLLPTRYAVGPARALTHLLSLLFAVLSFLVGLFLFLISLPLALLLPSLDRPTMPSAAPMPVPPAEQVGGESLPWAEVLASALFWVVILAIVGYALLRFVRDRMGTLEGEEGVAGTWWQRILLWLRELWHSWQKLGQEVQQRLVRRQREPGVGPPGARRRLGFLSLRRLAPRELVRYFYLSTVRRAAEAGQPRQQGQTPYEYETALGTRFGELEPDLRGLTEAFVEARYSRRPVEPDDAEAVKPLWQRIKAALRRRRATQI